MNKLEVEITKVQTSGGVVLVDMMALGCQMSALMIDSAEKPGWLEKGKTIYAIFKEAEVPLAKDFTGRISTRNRLPCKVLKIDKGELISLISLDFCGKTIGSAITSRAVDQLELQPGDEVTAFIKSNELTLMQKI